MLPKAANGHEAGPIAATSDQSGTYANDDDAQFAAAKYYRLAEEAGSKTLGNSWYVMTQVQPRFGSLPEAASMFASLLAMVVDDSLCLASGASRVPAYISVCGWTTYHVFVWTNIWLVAMFGRRKMHLSR